MDTSSESGSFNVSQNEEPKRRLKRLKKRRRRRKASGLRQGSNPAAMSIAATSSSNSTDTNAGDQPNPAAIAAATACQSSEAAAAGPNQLASLANKPTIAQQQQQPIVQQSSTEPPTICNTRQQAGRTAIAQPAQLVSSPSTPDSTTRSASEPSQEDYDDDESNCRLEDPGQSLVGSESQQQHQHHQFPPVPANRDSTNTHLRSSSSTSSSSNRSTSSNSGLSPITIPVQMIAASCDALGRQRPVNAVRVLFRSSSGHQLSSSPAATVNNHPLYASSNNGHNLLRQQHHQQSIVNANRLLIERQLEAIREADSRRWNFDFRNCRPLGMTGHRYVHCSPVETITTRDNATPGSPLHTNSAANITNSPNRTCRPLHDQNNQQVATTTTTTTTTTSEIRFTLHNQANRQWAAIATRGGHQSGKDSPHQHHSTPEDK